MTDQSSDRNPRILIVGLGGTAAETVCTSDLGSQEQILALPLPAGLDEYRTRAELGSSSKVTTQYVFDAMQGKHIAVFVVATDDQKAVVDSGVLARRARERGAVSMVFGLYSKEGGSVIASATEQLREISDAADVVFLMKQIDLLSSIHGVVDLVLRPGFVNVDLWDIRTILSGAKWGAIATAHAEGEARAERAIQQVLAGLRRQEVSFNEAKGVIVNVQASEDLTMEELELINSEVSSLLPETADAKCGMSAAEKTPGVGVTVVVVGPRIHSNAIGGLTKESGESTSGLLDITIDADPIELYVGTGVPSQEAADLIDLLSKAYMGVGGDRLVIQAMRPLPPGTDGHHSAPRPVASRRLGLGRR